MIKSYLDQLQQILFQDFDRAWIFVSLLFLIASFLLRWILTATLKKHSKQVGSKNMKLLNERYLRRSLMGWLCYTLSLAGFLLYWYTAFFGLVSQLDSDLLFALGSGIFFLLSVIFHLSAYAISCLDQIKLLEDKQLTP